VLPDEWHVDLRKPLAKNEMCKRASPGWKGLGASPHTSDAITMRCCNQAVFRQQARFLRHQFLQDGGLPLSDVLSEDVVARSLTATKTCWLDRIYSPLVTLWVSLGQVLSADHSCRAAVARLIAHRLSRGQGPCSAETGAYCRARKRLPEEFFSDVARRTGRALAWVT
jgi:hypothetical protein